MTSSFCPTPTWRLVLRLRDSTLSPVRRRPIPRARSVRSCAASVRCQVQRPCTLPSMRWMQGYTAALFASLPDTLSKAGVEGMVLDQYQPYVELIPMHLRMPFVHVSNALHVDYTGRTPICFMDWPYETGVDALARNREGIRRARILLEPVTAEAQAYAKKIGLSIDWSNPHSTLSPLAWVTQCPKEFDFGRAPDFPQFHYAGPFHDGRGRIEVVFPWQQLAGAPIVYASMGTLQNGLTEIFRAIVKAAVGLRELQFV